MELMQFLEGTDANSKIWKEDIQRFQISFYPFELLLFTTINTKSYQKDTEQNA